MGCKKDFPKLRDPVEGEVLKEEEEAGEQGEEVLKGGG